MFLISYGKEVNKKWWQEEKQQGKQLEENPLQEKQLGEGDNSFPRFQLFLPYIRGLSLRFVLASVFCFRFHGDDHK